MYIPLWLLYFIPFIFICNIIIKVILINISLWWCKKYTRNEDVSCGKTGFITAGITFLSEFIGLALFRISEHIFPIDFLYDKYTYFNSGIFIVTVVLMFVGNYKLNFRKVDLTKKQKIIAGLIVTALVAPYLFLIPN